MLSDRDYMRDPLDNEPGPSWTLTGNKILMIGLVGLFFMQILVDKMFPIDIKSWVGLSPSSVIEDFFIWQPITYMFFHPESLLVILFNLIGLFFFGPIVEALWGRKKYLLFFLGAGVFAGLVVTPLAYLDRLSHITLLGAAGPVLAVLVAAALANPNMKVLLFFVIPMKIKYMIMLFLGIDFLILIQTPQQAIGQAIPHMAGAAFGFLYYRYSNQIDSFFEGLEKKPQKEVQNETRSRQQIRSEEVDRILDKINNEGINKLTEQERKLLQQASEELNREDPFDRFQKDSR